MDSLKRKLVGFVVITGTLVAVYELLLTPEARKKLVETGSKVKEVMYQLKSVADDHIGTYVEEDVIQNRLDVEAEWAKIGF
ncbi:MAG: hypothetical protein J6D54_10335 [Olsenella sp.]|nr:hypothetical protein [Olsenella sp.]